MGGSQEPSKKVFTRLKQTAYPYIRKYFHFSKLTQIYFHIQTLLCLWLF